MMKKTTMLAAVLLTAAVVVSSASVTAAAGSYTAEDARRTAEKHLPASVVHLKTEIDDGDYEVKFRSADGTETYKFEVDRSTGRIFSVKTELRGEGESTRVAYSEREVKNLVLAEFPKADILSVTLEKDGAYRQYLVGFTTKDVYGQMEINPETGAIHERKLISADAWDSNFITPEELVKAAARSVPGGSITDVDLDYRNGARVFEIELFTSDREYRLVLDAKTGKELSLYGEDRKDDSSGGSSSSGSSSTAISADRAREIALNRVPGAAVKKLKLDHDDGRAVYEVELYKDGWEYEMDIDAATGTILDFEQDYDD